MRILLLGGTLEAREIATALCGDTKIKLSISLARAEHRPQDFGCPLRVGGWGGRDAFQQWTSQEGIEGIVDATHPFAGRMAQRAADTARVMGLEHVRVVRPPWMPEKDDDWTNAGSELDALRIVPQGSTVFLATGRRGLEHIADYPSLRVICRVKGPPPKLFSSQDVLFLSDLGPYSVEGEMRVLQMHNVSWLIARNSGGRGSWPKLEAARHLGIKVAMIHRPPQPDCKTVSTVPEALSWVRNWL